MSVPTFAAVDVGSNSCRLKVAAAEAHRWTTLCEDREVTRLGESVFRTGVIGPEAMEVTVEALRRFHTAAQVQVVDRVWVVATSAMREARNAEAFAERVWAATGWTVEVISGLEEGRLIHLGVVTQEPDAKGRCLLIDLGGGSCEVTLSDGGRVEGMVSLPLGAVRLQQYLETDPPTDGEVWRLRQYIERELREADRTLTVGQVSAVIATSGTASALAEASVVAAGEAGQETVARKALVSGAGEERRAKPRAGAATTAQVRVLAERLVTMSNAEREAVPGIGPKRSEIIAGGALVYAALLERYGLRGFRYSPLGLRDGMLAQMRLDAGL